MDKKAKNKLANKAKKQRMAIKLLQASFEEGGDDALFVAILTGNQYVRQVVSGKGLCEGVEMFGLTIQQAMRLAALRMIVSDRKEEERDRLKTRLRDGSLTIERMVRNYSDRKAMNAMMDGIVRKALDEGRITQEQFDEIMASREVVAK